MLFFFFFYVLYTITWMRANTTNLSESGETMKAAGLRAIDTVVESQAVLIKSRNPSNAELVDKIAQRIEGRIAAQRYVLCMYNIIRTKLADAIKLRRGSGRLPSRRWTRTGG
jgi:ATP phosphoribosyltransferase